MTDLFKLLLLVAVATAALLAPLALSSEIAPTSLITSVQTLQITEIVPTIDFPSACGAETVSIRWTFSGQPETDETVAILLRPVPSGPDQILATGIDLTLPSYLVEIPIGERAQFKIVVVNGYGTENEVAGSTTQFWRCANDTGFFGPTCQTPAVFSNGIVLHKGMEVNEIELDTEIAMRFEYQGCQAKFKIGTYSGRIQFGFHYPLPLSPPSPHHPTVYQTGDYILPGRGFPRTSLASLMARLDYLDGKNSPTSRVTTSIFTVYGYDWNEGSQIPAVCPTKACGFIQPVTPYECRRWNSSTESLVVDDSICVERYGPKPVPILAEDPCPMTACPANSLCNAFDNVSCDCLNGFGGVDCEVEPLISDLALVSETNATPLTEINQGSQARIHYSFTGSATTIRFQVLQNDSVVFSQDVEVVQGNGQFVALTIPTTWSPTPSASLSAFVVPTPSSSASSNLFSIFEFQWSHSEVPEPQTCPETNCAAVATVFRPICTRTNSVLTLIVSTPSSCPNPAPEPLFGPDCPPRIECQNDATCSETEFTCDCVSLWSGPDCSIRTTFSNLLVTVDNVPTQVAHIGTTSLKLTWDSSGFSVPIEILYKTSGTDPDPVIVSDDLESNLLVDEIILPYGLTEADAARLALRVVGENEVLDALPAFKSISYSWTTTEWSECQPTFCVEIPRWRDANCLSSEGTVENSSFCDPSVLPHTQEACSVKVCQKPQSCNIALGICDCPIGTKGDRCDQAVPVDPLAALSLSTTCSLFLVTLVVALWIN